MQTLDGKVAIVTGASRGIGFGIARAICTAGGHVVICSRNEQQIQEAADRLNGVGGGQVLAIAADVAVEDDVTRLFELSVSHFGHVDILVNNAGCFDGGPLEDLDFESWNNVIGACLTGPFLCTRAAFRVMKSKGVGRVLNIGSISAQRPRMGSVPYTSAKFGVQGLTQAAALEGREHGIVVSCLHPGNVFVERRQGTELDSDQEPMMEVESIVAAAMTMLTMPDHVNFLDAVVLPARQLYVGRG